MGDDLHLIVDGNESFVPSSNPCVVDGYIHMTSRPFDLHYGFTLENRCANSGSRRFFSGRFFSQQDLDPCTINLMCKDCRVPFDLRVDEGELYLNGRRLS